MCHLIMSQNNATFAAKITTTAAVTTTAITNNYEEDSYVDYINDINSDSNKKSNECASEI